MSVRLTLFLHFQLFSLHEQHVQMISSDTKQWMLLHSEWDGVRSIFLFLTPMESELV